MTRQSISPETNRRDAYFPRIAKITPPLLGGVLALNAVVVADRISGTDKVEPQLVTLELETSPVIAELVDTPTVTVRRSKVKPPSTGILPPKITQPECVKSSIAWLPETVARWHPYVAATAKAFDFPAEMQEILIFFETLGDPEAISHQGAEGVVQVEPATGKGLERQLKLPPLNLKDPASNIYLSGKYIRNVMDSGKVDLSGGFNAEAAKRVAIAYHGGEGALDIYLGFGFKYLRQGSPKTARYGERVAQAWDERNLPTSRAYDDLMRTPEGQQAMALASERGTPPC